MVIGGSTNGSLCGAVEKKILFGIEEERMRAQNLEIVRINKSEVFKIFINLFFRKGQYLEWKVESNKD